MGIRAGIRIGGILNAGGELLKKIRPFACEDKAARDFDENVDIIFSRPCEAIDKHSHIASRMPETLRSRDKTCIVTTAQFFKEVTIGTGVIAHKKGSVGPVKLATNQLKLDIGRRCICA
jgi:hypothetical protein